MSESASGGYDRRSGSPTIEASKGMTARQLHDLLHGLEDTKDFVMRRGAEGDVLEQVWRAAQEDADEAYADWREEGGPEPYLAYRAAADRADAALDALMGQRRAA